MYDQEANTQTAPQANAGHQGKANPLGHPHGKRDPVHLRIGNGGQLYVRFVGQGSGQRRNLQDDFTRFFYSYRRHDWVPVWYQTHAE